MLILALDTSTPQGSIALADDQKLLAECTVAVTKGHAKFLLPTIDQLLSQTGLKVGDIEAIACAVGPGSFAALRVGISTVKGLAFANQCKTVSVNTLEAMAWPFGYTEKTVCPILDAKKKEVYAAVFKGSGDGKILRDSEDMAISPEKLAEILPSGTLVFGDGAKRYAPLFGDNSDGKFVFVPEHLCYHRAGAIVALGLDLLKSGMYKTDLKPNYIRPPDAVVGKSFFKRSSNGGSR